MLSTKWEKFFSVCMLKCCDFCDVLLVSEAVYIPKMRKEKKKEKEKELTYDLQSLGIPGLDRYYIA